MGKITIIGVGSEAGDMTLRGLDAISSCGRVILHTGRCAASDVLTERGIPFSTLDDLYDAAEDFDQHTRLVTERILREAEDSDVAYCVTDTRDETVRAIAAQADVAVIPGVPVDGGLYDRCDGGMQCFSAVEAPDARLSPFHSALIREIDSQSLASLVKLRLMEVYPEEASVYLLKRGHVSENLLTELDRLDGYDQTVSVFVPAVRDITGLEKFDFDCLTRIVRRLCDPDGCPWDRVQTHESIRSNVIEEAYEVVDAIDRGDEDGLYDELGDLLMQVALHAEIGRRHGEFDAASVTTAICEKLIRRHTYVFGDGIARDAESAQEVWRQQKMLENGQSTAGETLSSVANALPALMRSQKLARRAAAAGFAPTKEDALRAFREAAAGMADEQTAGDALLSAAVAAEAMGIDAELQLREAGKRFTADFISIERELALRGEHMSDFAPDEILRCFITKRQERMNHE